MYSIDNPAALREALGAVAGNLSFSWIPGARELFDELDSERFAALDHNPSALLADLSDDVLAHALTPEYAERVQRVSRLPQAELRAGRGGSGATRTAGSAWRTSRASSG